MSDFDVNDPIPDEPVASPNAPPGALGSSTPPDPSVLDPTQLGPSSTQPGAEHGGGQPGQTLTPQQIYTMLRQMGASVEEAAVLTAMVRQESGFRTNALNDGSSTGSTEYSIGLLQVNMLAWGKTFDGNKLYDAWYNLAAGLHILRVQGVNAWFNTATKAFNIGDALAGAAAYGDQLTGDQVRLAKDSLWRGGGSGNIDPNAFHGQALPDAQGGGGGEPPGGLNIPPGDSPDPTANDQFLAGAQLYRDGDVYVLRYQLSPGVWIEWSTTDEAALRRSGYDPASAQAYVGVGPDEFLVNYKEAGNATEIAKLIRDGYNDLQAFFDETILKYFGKNHPWVDDPEIRWIIARIMANPQVAFEDPALIQAWIRNTAAWQATGDQANKWNDMSLAQRDEEIDKWARLLQAEFFDFTGRWIHLEDDRLLSWARKVASGRNTFGEISQVIRDYAARDPESPWSRQLRDEDKNRGQFGVDVENTVEQLRALAQQWGLNPSEDRLLKWARRVNVNDMSLADVTQMFRDQAQALYPWKDPNVPTMDAAEPWVQLYQRMMETGDVSLLNPDIQQALQAGWTLVEFEQYIRQQPDWMKTKNAQDQAQQIAGQMGRTMGFI